MPISQRQIEELASELAELANELDVSVLEELRRVTNRIIDNPDQDFEARINRVAEERADIFVERGNAWAETALASAYLAGIQAQDSELSRLVSSPRNEGNAVPPSRFPEKTTISGTASAIAREKLKDFPEHLETYAGFENTFKETIGRSKNPYTRSSVQAYREIARQSIEPAFVQGDKATRIELSQRILNRFSDKGIETVVFPSGHRMSMGAFSEREARSYINKCGLQGSIGRAQQRGYDLVRITQYAGASPMCEPHQGKVYSLSGNSRQYPPFDDAVFDGSYDFGSGIGHDYCGHQSETYIPGVSEELGPLSQDPHEQRILREQGEARGNRFIFEAEQEQRRIERQIRSYKRRQATSLTKSDRDRAGQLVRNWQDRQREWIDQNPFLRRRYTREAI